MKALLVCSVHALFDISALERRAFNAALAKHGLPALLGARDHLRIIETTTMLEMINCMPGDDGERRALAKSYLEFLNEAFWNAPVEAYQSVYDALMDPNDYARPKGFVSEYPLLTTNLARAAALLSNATKLGSIVAPLDPQEVQPMADGLATCAKSLNISHNDIDVLVARYIDFETARSIGMRPTLIKEVQKENSEARFQKSEYHQRRRANGDNQFPSQGQGWGDQVRSNFRHGCATTDHAFPPKSGNERIFG